jgi:hypothetical protein
VKLIYLSDILSALSGQLKGGALAGVRCLLQPVSSGSLKVSSGLVDQAENGDQLSFPDSQRQWTT